ncbi:MAG: hypothetical protein Q7K25_09890 [Actinomycetota bacterium]|nr:hypothetical protein [Actinomycetota bacterium]
MSKQFVEPDSADSEHVVGKALAVEPPLVVSALVLAIGLTIAIKAVAHMRRRPVHRFPIAWRATRHA